MFQVHGDGGSEFLLELPDASLRHAAMAPEPNSLLDPGLESRPHLEAKLLPTFHSHMLLAFLFLVRSFAPIIKSILYSVF